MARRSTPQKKIDEQAFPVRIKVAPTTGGFGFGTLLNDMIYWLQDSFPGGDFAQHSTGDNSRRTNTFIYFRTLEAAQRFLAHFPTLELDDQTKVGSGYPSPALPFGRKEP